jgi:large subunit ribosomal protein L13
MEHFIDASNQIAGRLASIVTKLLLKGDTATIVNAEKAVISGDKVSNIEHYREKHERGEPYHGPFYPREPDMMLRRIIRGMLPHKPRGRDAFKRLRVYKSVPLELKGKKFKGLKFSENNLESKHIEIGEISIKLGAKKTW